MLKKSEVKKILQNFGQNYNVIKVYTPKDTDKEIEDCINDLEIETAYECEFCEDTGRVRVMAPVYENEPYMADTESEICSCRLDNDDADY